MKITPPNRSNPFVNEKGFPDGERIWRWIELVSSEINSTDANVNRAIQVKTSDYTLLFTDKGVQVDSSSTVNITLVDPSIVSGYEFFISNEGSGTVNALTGGSETIGGQASIAIGPGTPWPTLTVISDGVNYTIT